MSQDAKISVEEGNAKIAKFMGCEFGHGFWAGTGNYFFPNDKATADELKYHSSWDWLMPVVEKIHKIINEKMNDPNYRERLREEKSLNDVTGWRAWSYRYPHLSTNIQSVWEDCGQFIQWYQSHSEGDK